MELAKEAALPSGADRNKLGNVVLPPELRPGTQSVCVHVQAESASSEESHDNNPEESDCRRDPILYLHRKDAEQFHFP